VENVVDAYEFLPVGKMRDPLFNLGGERGREGGVRFDLKCAQDLACIQGDA